MAATVVVEFVGALWNILLHQPVNVTIESTKCHCFGSLENG